MTPPGRIDLRWRRSHLGALLLLCVPAAAGLALPLARDHIEFSPSPAAVPERTSSARQRIDPNTASVASLVRLRGIGEVLAKSIVKYRRENGPGAFRFAGDLELIKGIGPATVHRIAADLSIPHHR